MFVNIFGGIVRCDEIARVIIAAAQEINITVPIVVRLQGTHLNNTSCPLLLHTHYTHTQTHSHTHFIGILKERKKETETNPILIQNTTQQHAHAHAHTHMSMHFLTHSFRQQTEEGKGND